MYLINDKAIFDQLDRPIDHLEACVVLAAVRIPVVNRDSLSQSVLSVGRRTSPKTATQTSYIKPVCSNSRVIEIKRSGRGLECIDDGGLFRRHFAGIDQGVTALTSDDAIFLCQLAGIHPVKVTAIFTYGLIQLVNHLIAFRRQGITRRLLAVAVASLFLGIGKH